MQNGLIRDEGSCVGRRCARYFIGAELDSAIQIIVRSLAWQYYICRDGDTPFSFKEFLIPANCPAFSELELIYRLQGRCVSKSQKLSFVATVNRENTEMVDIQPCYRETIADTWRTALHNT